MQQRALVREVPLLLRVLLGLAQPQTMALGLRLGPGCGWHYVHGEGIWQQEDSAWMLQARATAMPQKHVYLPGQATSRIRFHGRK